MKKIFFVIFLGMLSLSLASCDNDESGEKTSSCKSNPLSEGCLVIDELELIEPSIGDEYEVEDDFESDYEGTSPLSWILYRNDMYEIDSVSAVVTKGENNKFVKLYSDGRKGPLYHPQDRSLLFARPFNLDYSEEAYALADVYLPEGENNDFYFEVATGAVGFIGIRVNKEGKISVVTGGQFEFYEVFPPIHSTDITLCTNKWYTLKLKWNLKTEVISAYIYLNDEEVELYSGLIHRSNRYAADVDGEVLAPNVVRITMPKTIVSNGYVYLDNVEVRRSGAQ